MNNRRSKIWRWAFVVVIVLFFISILVSVYAIARIPQQYVNKQNEQITLVKGLIDEGISTNNIAKFKDIKATFPVEFLVYNTNTDEIIYSTIKVNNQSDLTQELNRNAVAFEEVYNVSHNGVDYNVWFVQYHISPQDTFDTWIIFLIMIIIMVIAFNIIAIIIFYQELLKPVKRLKDNILKISKYQLDSLNTKGSSFEYDQLSKQLVYFAKDLEKYLSKTNYSYTELEKNLQLKNEDMMYRTQMVASLTHNLKAPIVNETLYLQEIERSNYDLPTIKKNVVTLMTINQKLLEDINVIGEMVYQDNTAKFLQDEKLDLIPLIMASYDTFINQFKTKKYNVVLDIDEKVMVFTNKISIIQIIHNALANIYAYGAEFGAVEISCYKEGDNCYLSFYNEAKPFSDEDLENIFKLFYRISDSKEGQGTGLFTIKRLAEELGGDVQMRNEREGVILEFVFKDRLDD